MFHCFASCESVLVVVPQQLVEEVQRLWTHEMFILTMNKAFPSFARVPTHATVQTIYSPQQHANHWAIHYEQPCLWSVDLWTRQQTPMTVTQGLIPSESHWSRFMSLTGGAQNVRWIHVQKNPHIIYRSVLEVCTCRATHGLSLEISIN